MHLRLQQAKTFQRRAATVGVIWLHRCSWDGANGLFSFSVPLRRNMAFRIIGARSIHGKPGGSDTFLDATIVVSAIVRFRKIGIRL